MRALEVGRLPGDEDLAGVALIGAGQDLHQRRLAGRVVADEAEDLAGIEHEVDVAQRLHGAERLLDAAHLDDGLRLAASGIGGFR